MKKLFLLALASLSLAACQPNQKVDEGTGPTIQVTDASGSKEVPSRPRKVVVTDLGLADTIRLMDKEETIIGMPDNVYPEYIAEFAAGTEKVGSMKEPNMEVIAGLEPDLIIISARLSDYEDELSKIAPTLNLSLDNTNYWESTQENARILGQVYGEEELVETAIEDLDTKINETQALVEEINSPTLVLMRNGEELTAFSAGSRFGFLFDNLGFQSINSKIDESTHGQEISYEGILEINPERIFVIDRNQAVNATASAMKLEENEILQRTTANQKGQIYPLSAELWYLSGNGLESTDLMVDEVREAIQ